MLTDGQPKDGIRQETRHVSERERDLEPVQRRVVREVHLLDQLGMVKVGRGGQYGDGLREVLLRGEDQGKTETEGDDEDGDLDVQVFLD